MLIAMRHLLTHITAHQCALRAGILHRDLSPGNIMIMENEEENISDGILIDWDLSKFINTQDEARQHTRTVSRVSEPLYLFSADIYCYQGTWQFMAGDLVYRPGTPQTFLHDLESAFWVLLYLTLLYVETTYNPEERSSIIQQTMNPKNIKGYGGMDKINFMSNPKSLIKLRTPQNPKVTVALKFMLLVLGERYRKQHDPGLLEASSLVSSTPTLDNSMLHVINGSTDTVNGDREPDDVYEELLNGLKKALDDPSWTGSDPAVLQPIDLPVDEERAVHSGTKRSKSVAEQHVAFVQPPAPKRTAFA